jgi:hypothetical protein
MKSSSARQTQVGCVGLRKLSRATKIAKVSSFVISCWLLVVGFLMKINNYWSRLGLLVSVIQDWGFGYLCFGALGISYLL